MGPISFGIMHPLADDKLFQANHTLIFVADKLLNVSICNLKCLILRLGIFVIYSVISKATEVAELSRK